MSRFVKEYMEKARAERIRFEREMAEKREKINPEQTQSVPEENNLSGQNEK